MAEEGAPPDILRTDRLVLCAYMSDRRECLRVHILGDWSARAVCIHMLVPRAASVVTRTVNVRPPSPSASFQHSGMGGVSCVWTKRLCGASLGRSPGQKKMARAKQTAINKRSATKPRRNKLLPRRMSVPATGGVKTPTPCVPGWPPASMDTTGCDRACIEALAAIINVIDPPKYEEHSPRRSPRDHPAPRTASLATSPPSLVANLSQDVSVPGVGAWSGMANTTPSSGDSQDDVPVSQLALLPPKQWRSPRRSPRGHQFG